MFSAPSKADNFIIEPGCRHADWRQQNFRNALKDKLYTGKYYGIIILFIIVTYMNGYPALKILSVTLSTKTLLSLIITQDKAFCLNMHFIGLPVYEKSIFHFCKWTKLSNTIALYMSMMCISKVMGVKQ